MTLQSIKVYHNDVDISSYLVNYTRDKNICTGIGVINVILSQNYATNIDTWDEIKITEDGEQKGIFFVSEISRSDPEYNVVITAQDASKRLTDYFIPDYYYVDYPSLNTYWINLFVTEVGLSYTFLDESGAVLLNNPTELGRRTAYEQLLELCQVSGWFMFFDYNNTLTIGKLQPDLDDVEESYDDNTIISIVMDKNDSYLRNRAVVWGIGDVDYGGWVFAEAKVNTKWNYDDNDYRTVIIQSSAPNYGSAQTIANQLITEFSTILNTKDVRIAGFCSVDVGDIVSVENYVWTGTGLVTSLTVEVTEQGSITELILDEKCPRLYAIFDYGDVVYIGTQGDGVWKKPIRWAHIWQNHSVGLTNLNITDLHASYGVLSCVSKDGDMYKSLKTTNWYTVSIPTLESYENDTPEPEDELVEFSDIKGRATIIDRQTNVIKYLVDTYSGENIVSYSGWSMDIPESGCRAWVVETTIGGILVSHPINIDGNYCVKGFDIENDSTFDYISVVGTATISGDLGQNRGGYFDDDAYVTIQDSVPISGVKSPDDFYWTGWIAIFDDEDSGISEGFGYRKDEEGDNQFVLARYTTISGFEMIYSDSFTQVAGSICERISDTVYKTYSSSNIVTWDMQYDVGDVTAQDITGDYPAYFVPNEAHRSRLITSLAYKGNLYVSILDKTDYEAVAKLYLIDSSGLQDTGVSMTIPKEYGLNELGETITRKWYGTQFYVNPCIEGNSWIYLARYDKCIAYNSYDYVVYCYGYYNNTSNELSSYHDNSIWPPPIMEYIPAGVNSSSLTGMRGIASDTNSFFAFRAITEEHNSDVYPYWQKFTYTYTFYINGEITSEVADIYSDSYDFRGIGTLFHDTPQNFFRATDLLTGTYYLISASTGNILSSISAVDYELEGFFHVCDRSTGYFYGIGTKDSVAYLLAFTNTGNITWAYQLPNMEAIDYTGPVDTTGRNCGNLFFLSAYDSWYSYLYRVNPTNTACYILKRNPEDNTYESLQESSEPLRIDLSSPAFSPLVTAGDIEVSFRAYDTFTGSESSLRSLNSFAPTAINYVNDYRAYMMDNVTETELANIGDIAIRVIYTSEDEGIFALSQEDFVSSDLLYTISGLKVDKIETTNFYSPSQFIFVSTTSESGVSFWQRDPPVTGSGELGFFERNNSLPDSNINIIRVDDRI